MSPHEARPYEQLAELLQSERELVAGRRFDELERLLATSAALIATLPPIPPPTTRAALERCAALNQQVRDELLRARETALAALAEVHRGQRAARGYAPFRRRRPRISTNA